jgi:hypothetical protein
VAVDPAGIVANFARYVSVAAGLVTGKGGRDATDLYQAQQRAILQLVSVGDGVGQLWRELLLADGRVDPNDQAAFKLELAAWLATLTPRTREAAILLAEGY